MENTIKLNIQQLIIDRLRQTKRKNIEVVIDYMVKNGYFTRHCHSHHRYYGGHADHAWQTYQIALKQNKTYNKRNPLDEDSIAICSLLHDFYICRGMDEIHGHGGRSAAMLKKLGFKLPIEEFNAIRFHMGRKNKPYYELFEKAKNQPLRLLVHKADGKSASRKEGHSI